ncbi:MAG: trypsin-like peptidase domain-containing protein [Verrucomicrobia bacterium]|nr:trypsin-like peptidase domain-containing protein [Verrucomicrobiota bacterium]
MLDHSIWPAHFCAVPKTSPDPSAITPLHERFLFSRIITGALFRSSRILLCLVLGLAIPPKSQADTTEPEKSVIHIMCFSQEPVWDAPWRFTSVRRGTGSGFVIEGKRIMTNAHVVSWDRQILVKRYQDPRQYIATVEFIAHDCDLAILRVEDERFFDGLEPLEFGELPKVRSTVVTYGYPAGGEQISYTRGVVSRIDINSYVHQGNRSFLGVQTDAAINPGNSGGPVIQDDRVVGVAFQGTPGLENTGFFIPHPVIQHFLIDIADGTYHGFPQAGIRLVATQNPAYRRFLGLPDNDSGARVDSLVEIPSTREVIREEDVILQIGPYPVGSDGTILYEGNRVFGAMAFQEAQHGESVSLKLWRDRKEIEVSLPVFHYDGDNEAGNQYGTPPRYFVYGGLIFTPLCMDYLKTFGRNWADAANAELVYEIFYRRHEDPQNTRPEPIVLADTLADPVNANFIIHRRALVDKVNGIRINSLDDVIRAFETATADQHVIEFIPHQGFECLDRNEAAQANNRILQTYSVPSDRRL